MNHVDFDTETAPARVRVFASGNQELNWAAKNCEQCTKFVDDKGNLMFACDIDSALLEAALSDRTVPYEIAVRMGWEGVDAWTWDCPEREMS